jgi:hypothetical protein
VAATTPSLIIFYQKPLVSIAMPDVNSSPRVDIPVSVPMPPTLLTRVPNEIWVRIFRYVVLLPGFGLVKRSNFQAQTYISSEGFELHCKVTLLPILLSCRMFNNFAMICFCNMNAVRLGPNLKTHIWESLIRLPPIHMRPCFRRVSLLFVINDWYHAGPKNKMHPVCSVRNLFRYNQTARILRNLTNARGFTNLEGLNIIIVASCEYDPWVTLYMLRQANIKITAGMVRAKMFVYQPLSLLTSVRPPIDIEQTNDQGDPFCGRGVEHQPFGPFTY